MVGMCVAVHYAIIVRDRMSRGLCHVTSRRDMHRWLLQEYHLRLRLVDGLEGREDSRRYPSHHLAELPTPFSLLFVVVFGIEGIVRRRSR